MREEEEGGGGETGRRPPKRCVVIVDSNGRGATEDTIKSHIPKEERECYSIKVEVVYTLEEACLKVERRLIDVREALVVLDSLTNNVRGTKERTADSPQQLVYKVATLREKLYAQGAADIVVCQIKPMTQINVLPYNNALNDFLNSQIGGFGIATQIRLRDLKSNPNGNGFHILPEFVSVLDRTYACAIRGIPVPCPTCLEDFLPEQFRLRWEKEWPIVGGGRAGPTNHYGRY